MSDRIHALQQALLTLEEEGYEINHGHNAVGPEVIDCEDAIVTGELQFDPEDSTLIACFSARSVYPFTTVAAGFLVAMKKIFEENGDTFEVDGNGGIQFVSEVEEPELFDSSDPEEYCLAFEEHFTSALETTLLCVHVLKQYAAQSTQPSGYTTSLDPNLLTEFCVDGVDRIQ